MAPSESAMGDSCAGLVCGFVGSGEGAGEAGLGHGGLLAARGGVEVPHPIAAGGGVGRAVPAANRICSLAARKKAL